MIQLGNTFGKHLFKTKQDQKKRIFLSQEIILLKKYFGYRRLGWGGTKIYLCCCSKFRVMRSAANQNHCTPWSDSAMYTTWGYLHIPSSVLPFSVSQTSSPFKIDGKLSIQTHRLWGGSCRLAVYVHSTHLNWKQVEPGGCRQQIPQTCAANLKDAFFN